MPIAIPRPPNLVTIKIGADLPTLLRALREVAKGPMVADSPTAATDAPTAE